MQSSSRAPVLSATLSLDSCWITGSSPGLLHDLGEAPVLRLREGPRLDDPDDVARARLVPLVVRVELHGAPDDLLVLRVQLDHVDLDDDRLVALVGDDDAAALLPAAALDLGPLAADDRLARSRRLALRLRTLTALGARHVLARLGLLLARRVLRGGVGGLGTRGRSRFRSLLDRPFGDGFVRCRLLDRARLFDVLLVV